VDTLGIIRQMQADPALRAQLRSVLLGEEVLGLPAQVAENSRQIAELRAAVSGLQGAVAELRAAVSGLQGAVAELRTEVGHLSAIVGGTVEEDAASLVRTVLERQGVRLDGEPEAVGLDGEIDVVARGTETTGAPITALVEAKTRLRPADVRRFAASYRSLVARLGVEGAHVGYVYGFRVYSGSDEAARQVGLGVLSPDGERVPPVSPRA